jgi:dihydroceramidase
MAQVSFRGSKVPVGNDGHWGLITSSVDWCELNYQFSHYIAEFWNSTSSFSMVFAGLFGILLHRSIVETRFLLAFFFVSVLGIGSVMFHGSLKHETQMLDELPMLYAAFTTTFILLENEISLKRNWLAPFLFAWSIVTSCATFFASGTWQFVMFHASFGSAEFFSLYRVYAIYSKWRDNPKTDSKTTIIQKDITYLFKRGMTSYGIGLFVWQFDLRYCRLLQVIWPKWSGLPNPQFHAWWHVCVSCGFYLLITLTVYDRMIVLKTEPKLCWFSNIVPYVGLRERSR